MLQARNAIEIERVKYQRHRPENTLLYQLVERYYPKFQLLLSEQETPLSYYVHLHSKSTRHFVEASIDLHNKLSWCL